MTDDFAKFDNEISEKWSKKWEELKLFEAEPIKDKPKFYLTAAYPYPNGPLHLGHARTYLIPDVIARYKRLKGYNVLFPMAFHFTGTPILTVSEALANGDSKLIKEFTELYEVDPKDLDKLKSPLGMANYFRERAKRDMKNYMLSIDWRREFTTIDEEYKQFITWQFKKLYSLGYITKGTHPVGWCPVHQMPVGMHDTKGDVEPEIQEYILILFSDGKMYYPTATLRPETVFGVTNLWINPEAEYVVASVNGRKYVLSKEAFFKIRFQKKNVELVEDLGKGENLLGRAVINPVTGKKVKILPAKFVDPGTGTGIVMSVPAHAPFDYAGIIDFLSSGKVKEFEISESELEPIPLIIVDGYSKYPAKDAVEKYKVSSPEDKEKLEKATKEIYLEEYSKGIIREDLITLVNEVLIANEIYLLAKKISGKSVKDIKKSLSSELVSLGIADTFYEIANKPVYCRCGNEIVVKILENQWFIDYENPTWKDMVRGALEHTVEIVPIEYKEWFKNTIDWLKKRACARSRGLGTKLPWEEGWIIESLSDSTLYMAFYTVIHKIRKLSIPPSLLGEDFWDYVFLGKGNVQELAVKLGKKPEDLESIRTEFLYWYPLDNRHSGKDLVPNHLTFMLFNHVAIFPEELWPRRIVVNGHIMVEGEKMSKSLGNFIPLFKAIRDSGPNTLRLTLLYSAEIGNDANYSKELVKVIQGKLRGIYELLTRIHSEKESVVPPKERRFLEKWLITRFKYRVQMIESDLEKYMLRDAVVHVYFGIQQDIEEYLNLVEYPDMNMLWELAKKWVILMSPFTPSFAEELWYMMTGGSLGSVHTQEWPKIEKMPEYPEAEFIYIYMTRLLDDINSIKRALKKEPTKITIIVAGAEKWATFRKAVVMLVNGEDLKKVAKIMGKELGGVTNLYEITVQLSDFIQSLPQNVRKYFVESQIDELDTVKTILPYLKKLLGKVDISVYSEHESGLTLKRKPLPMKPTISFSFD